jgi:transketolase
MGDGEMAEGSVWEAANVAGYHTLDSLCGITDVNALGQSRATQFGHDLDAIAARWRRSAGTPSPWTATTSPRCSTRTPRRGDDRAPDDDPGAHAEGQGRVVRSRGGTAGTASRSRRARSSTAPSPSSRRSSAEAPAAAAISAKPRPPRGTRPGKPRPAPRRPTLETRRRSTRWATRSRPARRGAPPWPHRRRRPAHRRARRRREELDLQRQVREGVSRSLLPELHRRAGHGRRAMGLAARGAIPFPSTFACFLTRAADFIRMAGISMLNVKFAGSRTPASRSARTARRRWRSRTSR